MLFTRDRGVTSRGCISHYGLNTVANYPNIPRTRLESDGARTDVNKRMINASADWRAGYVPRLVIGCAPPRRNAVGDVIRYRSRLALVPYGPKNSNTTPRCYVRDKVRFIQSRFRPLCECLFVPPLMFPERGRVPLHVRI